jgi:hypothetical protein
LRLKSLILTTLFLTSIGFSIISTMAQIQMDPVGLTQELRSIVDSAPQELFRAVPGEGKDDGNLRDALIKKIDVVIMMFEKGNYQGGYEKLDKDISPKLNICTTTRVRARSWLSNDPAMRDEVEVLRDTCQGLIAEIKLADPRPTP